MPPQPHNDNDARPEKTIKLTGTQGSPITEQTHIVMPLYYAQFLPEQWG